MSSNTTINSKKWILASGLVAVVGSSLYVAGQYPFENAELTGTIAPAQRYQANQLGGDDVVLGDETVSRFIQTDGFQLIVEHPELVDVLSDARFYNLVLSKQFQDRSVQDRGHMLRQDVGIQRVLQDRHVLQLLSDDRFVMLAADNRHLLQMLAQDRAVLERNAMDRASMDRASMDRASMDRASMDRASMDRASMDRASLERNALDRTSLERVSSLARSERMNRATVE